MVSKNELLEVCKEYTLKPYDLGRVLDSGVSSMELMELEHPPQLWHNSQLSSSLTTIFTDNRKLAATTNNKLTGL